MFLNFCNSNEIHFVDETNDQVSDSEGATSQDDTIKALVIPEKASSFSIHPGRLCKDECSYCFGKFGLFDTPCHIAQMKSVDRQDKILASKFKTSLFKENVASQFMDVTNFLCRR